MGGQIVQHDPYFLGLWEVDIGKLAHAFGEILRGPSLCDFHLAPGFVRVEEDEEIGSAIAPIFAVEALQLSRLGRDRLAHLADKLGRALVEADDGLLGIGLLGIKIEHILHAGDVFGVDLWDAPHILAPRLEVVLRKPAAYRFAGKAPRARSA